MVDCNRPMWRCSVLAGVIVSLLLPMRSQADEWSARGGVDVHYKSHDNIRLRTKNKTSVQGFVVAPHVSTQWRTETSNVSAEFRLKLNRYDKQNFDSNNQDLTIDASHQFEHNKLSIEGVYNRDSTVTTELLDSGRIGDKAIRRTLYRVAPEWQWQISPRQTLDTSVSYEATSYGSSQYTDYHFTYASTTWAYQLTPRWQLQLQPYASRYKSQNSTPKTPFSPQIMSDTYGLQGGYTWLVSEQIQWSLLIGGSHRKSNYDPLLAIPLNYWKYYPSLHSYLPFDLVGHDASNSIVGQSNFTWTGEYWTVGFNVSSSEQPSGDGGVRQLNTANLKVNWRPRRYFQVQLQALIGRNSWSSNQNRPDRNFGSARLQLSWRFAENWWVRTSYDVRAQKYSSGAGTAVDNAVYLTLSWLMPRRIW